MPFSDMPSTVMPQTVVPETNSPPPITMQFAEGSKVDQENLAFQPLVAYVKNRFYRSKTRREQDERRWLECYRNYRGIYGPDVAFTSTEKSRVFIKITKTKVLAAYAQIVDVLFAGNKFPIGVQPTPVPNGDTPDAVHVDMKEPETPQSSSTIVRPELLGTLKKVLMGRADDKIKEGPGLTPSSATWEPLKMAARKMEKKIHDQLAESDAAMHLRNFAFELCLLGTGIIKGPFAYDKEYPMWNEKGEYVPKKQTIPRSQFVSLWNCYPDADAKNMKECDYFIERHKMSRPQLRDLKKRKSFRSESIELAIAEGPSYIPEYWESILEDNKTQPANESFEVLEYWGVIDKETADLSDLELPDELKDSDEIQVNAWICNSKIIRLVLNPFTPRRIPYHASPYELNPYSFFGIGVAENMSDTQILMNGFMRMAVDNAALSGNVILEINETMLTPGQNMEVFPGKIFKTQGQPGQAINDIKFENVTQELLSLYDKARQLTDEATSMPSYAHGGTGINQVGRTASGMSMLMGASDKTIKAVVRNIDDYILSPWGKDHFAFNMQFNFDPDLVGDLEVVAQGTESLMRNEVRSQKLLQFLQVVMGNPLTAPFGKLDYMLRELAASLDLEEDKVLNDPREAMLQAMVMQKMGMMTGAAKFGAGPQVGNGAADGATAPVPGAPGFAGGGGGDNGGDTTGGQPAPAQPQPAG